MANNQDHILLDSTWGETACQVVFVIDDDPQVCDAFRLMLETAGRSVRTFGSAEDFLAVKASLAEGCLLVDAHLPGMSGVDLLVSLRSNNEMIPAVVITGYNEVSTAVAAMKAGAQDFMQKPISREDLLAIVDCALATSNATRSWRAMRDAAVRRFATLTARQKQIMEMVLLGQPSKNIAADLGINQRTVENHRAAIMTKADAKSLVALGRLAILVEGNGR